MWTWNNLLSSEFSDRLRKGQHRRSLILENHLPENDFSLPVRMTRPLEQAVAAIVCTFQEYAGRCGDKYKICQSELKELLQKELPTWTPSEFRECDYNKFMSVLDTNKDCEVDFGD
ncbi:protein S100-A3 isoform X1 [Mus musculus]|uniref:protein S100-A3 isoform X1 n=1 Tax=Mus musculus TaxID=10090 RepID=UPI001679FC47|nr:protein S100-A3 isoform X1 [Mus musculus]